MGMQNTGPELHAGLKFLLAQLLAALEGIDGSPYLADGHCPEAHGIYTAVQRQGVQVLDVSRQIVVLSSFSLIASVIASTIA